MQKLTIFGANSDLAADLTDHDKGQEVNQLPEWYYARILAQLALMASSAAGGTFATVPLTFSTDTSIYASGDVLADTQALPGAVRLSGGSAKLTSITLLDKDDQAAAQIDAVFLRSNTSIGTENSGPSISDTDSLEILGVVAIPSANFIDFGGAKLATVILATPLPVIAASGTTIYVALITRGTPTQTASGLVGHFTFRQD